jgi:hypothetical protein
MAFARMSEINRPANAPKAATELTEIRRPRLWRLSPEMLREMAERTEPQKAGRLDPAVTTSSLTGLQGPTETTSLLGEEERSNQS